MEGIAGTEATPYTWLVYPTPVTDNKSLLLLDAGKLKLYKTDLFRAIMHPFISQRLTRLNKANCFILILHQNNSLVAGVLVFVQREEFLLDRPSTYEAQHSIGATGLVVCSTGATSTKGLLADKCSRRFAV